MPCLLITTTNIGVWREALATAGRGEGIGEMGEGRGSTQRGEGRGVYLNSLGLRSYRSSSDRCLLEPAVGLSQDNTNVEKAFVSAAARVKALTPAIQQTFNDTVDLSGKKGGCCLTN